MTAEPASRPGATGADDGYGLPGMPGWREIDWSQHERRVRLGEAEVTFAEIGHGESAVVFVHGLGGQWRNWLENLPAVAQAHRAVALDLPGFGGSDMPAGGVSIAGYARVVDALCDHLGLDAVTVVGNSMGGFVGAELAVSRPERVERLVLVDAAGIVPTRRERWVAVGLLRAAALLAVRGAAAHHRQLASRPRLRRAALRMVAHRPESLRADLVYHGMLDAPRPAMPAALTAAIGYLTDDWSERLSDIRCPTLIVWGDRDALLPVRHSSEFERRIPGSRAVTMRDTGHIPMAERPRAFNELLLEFLADASEAAKAA